MTLGQSGAPLGNAYIIPLQPKTDENGQQFIPLYYHFPFGTGNSINKYSALVKPFRKLIEERKPIGKIAFFFYHQNKSYIVLGSFAFAFTDKVIFFPGTTFSRIITPQTG